MINRIDDKRAIQKNQMEFYILALFLLESIVINVILIIEKNTIIILQY